MKNKIIPILAIVLVTLILVLPVVLAQFNFTVLNEARNLLNEIRSMYSGEKGETKVTTPTPTTDACAKWGGKPTTVNEWENLPEYPQSKEIMVNNKLFNCTRGLLPNEPNNIVCCKEVKRTCEQLEGTKVSKKEEKDKCKQPTQLIFGATDLTGDEICCGPKEPAREAPKKPGTLGRLQVCIGRYWIWDRENDKKFLENAKKALEGVNLNSIVGDNEAGAIKGLMNKIKEEKDPVKRADLIDELNPKLNKAQLKIAQNEIPTTTMTEEVQKTSYTKLSEAQDNLEKARAIHTMAWPEIVANLVACWGSMIKAGILSFQGGDNEMGKCSPERPLVGTDACLSCNEDPLRLCTRERCAILGNCIAVPTTKADQYVCIPGKCEETGLPLFNQINASWFVDGEINGSTAMALGGKTLNINLNNNKPLPFNTKTILINLTTDKPAQCKWILDKKNSTFAEMQDFENNYFPVTLEGEAGWQHAYILLPGDISRNMTHKIFIKCKNVCGVEPEASYDQNIISFTLDKKPDQLPPEIVYVDPATNSIIRGDLAIVNVSIWLDELGECKFSDKSINFTINYTAQPPNGMIRFGQTSPYPENSSVINGGCYRGRCLDRNESCSRCWLLLDTSKGYDLINYSFTEFNETKMFSLAIRCNDIAGNIMKEESILDYTLMTAPPYNISIIKPENGNRSYERNPEIEVTSEPRLTECRYRIFQDSTGIPINCENLNWSLMWPIDVGMSTLHKGKHNETLNGSASGLEHTICVKCRDMWQIEETAKANFYVLLDSIAPIVVRMYHDTTAGDYLIIETNEASECVYGTSDTIKCNYNFSDGSAMTTTNNYLHAAYWQLSNLYYIKCKDKWDNYPGGSSNANQCTAIINPFEIPSSS